VALNRLLQPSGWYLSKVASLSGDLIDCKMRYLTIKDYESEQEAIKDCLNELRKLHERFQTHVNLGCKDRKHAMYLLVGVAISAAYAAFDQYSKGFIVGVHQLARFILEVHSLAEYFLVISDEAGGEIEKWFKGEYVKTRFTKKTECKIEKMIEQKASIPFKALSKEELLRREKIIQENFETLSLYSHPTICSTMQPRTCYFSGLILIPVTDIAVDAQRLLFSEEDSITGLMFSEFRLLFEEFRNRD
jgi:hypothetical protein